MKEHKISKFNQEGKNLREKVGTREERMLDKRAQESMKVRNIHSRDNESLSKQVGKCTGESGKV